MVDKEYKLPFSFIDRTLRDMNPITEIVPLRVVADLSCFNATELRNLREYANAEDGTIERWLLVPSCMTIGAIDCAINKAFGLESQLLFSLPGLNDRDWFKIFPTIGSVVEASGVVINNAEDEELYRRYEEEQCTNPLYLVSGPFYPESKRPLKARINAIKAKYKDELEKVVKVRNKETKVSSLSSCSRNIKKYIDRGEGLFTPSLSLDLPLSSVLASKKSRTYPLDSQLKKLLNKKRIPSDFTFKPFLHSYDTLRFNEEGNVGFIFHVDMPEDYSELISDGFISIEDYMEAISYVSKTYYPDCVYKKGYDFFGLSVDDFYNFLMLFHSDIHTDVAALAREAGWREPYMDLKQVLRY